MTPHIAILGSFNIDLVTRVPHHPLPGETLTASSFSISPGGKGSNQAVACAKLSRPSTSPSASATNADATAHVRMVGSVGSDSYGQVLIRNLERHGVDATGVRVLDGRDTGIAFIVVDEPTGENRIILSPGANYALRPEEFLSLRSGPLEMAVGENKTDETRLLPDLLILQLEIPLQTVLAALAAAKAEGVPVLFNPAPAQPLPDEVYAGLDHLVVNETEAALLGGVGVDELDSEEGCGKVAAEFARRGCRNVVITLGGRGVYYFGSSETTTTKKGLIPAEKAKVVDTTAAGDTFVGQYALGAVLAGAAGAAAGSGKFDIEAAVRKANRAAKIAVERKGAADSIPWRDDVE